MILSHPRVQAILNKCERDAPLERRYSDVLELANTLALAVDNLRARALNAERYWYEQRGRAEKAEREIKRLERELEEINLSKQESGCGGVHD